jgi:predicted hydrolase (HD superfamily)
MSIIKASTINFNELVFSKDLSLTLTNSVVKELEENFTNDEQRWYVAQLYMYLNYHPTEDYPIKDNWFCK